MKGKRSQSKDSIVQSVVVASCSIQVHSRLPGVDVPMGI